MPSIKKYIRKVPAEYWVLAAIVLFGAFLRLYHFSDYLHFELDQARDVIFVSEGVINGPLDLPIMGPKASGTALRVGPAYYYMEYLSALFFGNTPEGHAFFVAILSIVSIVIFYLLLRRFFNAFISLGLIYLYSTSLFFVLFSRFSWNPNVLPFFIIAGLYCLLKATDGKSEHPGRWLVLTSFLFAIGTQLHFVAFVALPVLSAIFLAYKRARFSWRTWTACIFVMLVVYAPVIVNEIKFNGENIKYFFEAVTKKSSTEHNIVEKIIQNTLSEAEGYALMLSGDDHVVTPKLNLNANKISVSCADYCRKTNPLKTVLAISFFILGSLLLLRKSYESKNDLALIGIWFVATFLVFTILAYELPARFYLLSAPLPFVFLGLMIQLIWKKNEKLAKLMFLLILVLLSYSNVKLIMQRFSQSNHAGLENVNIPSDKIIDEPVRVSLLQQKTMANFLFEKYKRNGYPINVVYSEPFYRRSIKYLTEQLGAPIAPMNNEAVYLHSNSVIILRTKNEGKKIFDQYLQSYDIQERTEFGTLSVYSLLPKTDKLTATDLTPIRLAGGDTGDILRITWRDILNK